MVAEDKFTPTISDGQRVSLEGLKEVDTLRTDGAKTSAFSKIGLEDDVPNMDLAWAFATEENKRQAAKELEIVLRDIGFFTVDNHGADMDLHERLVAATRKFFHLPTEAKERYVCPPEVFRGYIGMKKSTTFDPKRPNISEGFMPPCWLHQDDQNLWPTEEVPEMRDLALAWIEQMREVGFKLNRLMAMAMGYSDDEEFFNRELFGNGKFVKNDFLRLNFYPSDMKSNAADRSFGFGAHTDHGWLTLLATDGNQGLQVRTADGRWIEPKPTKNQLIINQGDFVKRMSNDYYRSTLHRVHNPLGLERVSMPFFFNPWFEVTGSVCPRFVKDGEQPKYDPIKFRDHIEYKIMKEQCRKEKVVNL
eukprot:Clim_evm10s233 gene=Clim_evmTU10s233